MCYVVMSTNDSHPPANIMLGQKLYKSRMNPCGIPKLKPPNIDWKQFGTANWPHFIKILKSDHN